MSSGDGNTPLTGDEILKLLNPENVSHWKNVKIDDLADFLRDENINADVLIIMYLREISRKLNYIPELIEQQAIANKLTKEILS